MNNQKPTLEDIVLHQEPKHLLDIESQLISKMDYLFTSHFAYLEEYSSNSEQLKQEQEGFYFMFTELFTDLKQTKILKDKYIKYLELNQVKQPQLF